MQLFQVFQEQMVISDHPEACRKENEVERCKKKKKKLTMTYCMVSGSFQMRGGPYCREGAAMQMNFNFNVFFYYLSHGRENTLICILSCLCLNGNFVGAKGI